MGLKSNPAPERTHNGIPPVKEKKLYLYFFSIHFTNKQKIVLVFFYRKKFADRTTVIKLSAKEIQRNFFIKKMNLLKGRYGKMVRDKRIEKKKGIEKREKIGSQKKRIKKKKIRKICIIEEKNDKKDNNNMEKKSKKKYKKKKRRKIIKCKWKREKTDSGLWYLQSQSKKNGDAVKELNLRSMGIGRFALKKIDKKTYINLIKSMQERTQAVYNAKDDVIKL
ncbi:hypothetical protein RFI_23124 [Reticulomyxa filosa]|uniref:Uncharacterized protein n=1 Tax=Reticulomyxa filosa TaxID=46433 RepID=X6MKS8_RETFI|nr:hypothetical protein RFI_23124 [Reticulomyxa filosa]|eukprot:ETO14246.1 hypothetical protein RFI_23124 [Reticulomyxa filosa]